MQEASACEREGGRVDSRIKELHSSVRPAVGGAVAEEREEECLYEYDSQDDSDACMVARA